MVIKRIRGQDLAQNMGEEVVLLGKVETVSPNGKYVELQTTDNVKINVTLPDPMDGITEGYLEVWGTVQSKSTMLANSCTHFPPEQSENFSPDCYSEILSISNLLGDRKWRFSEDTTQLF